jgi:hypothetical protein
MPLFRLKNHNIGPWPACPQIASSTLKKRTILKIVSKKRTILKIVPKKRTILKIVSKAIIVFFWWQVKAIF